MDEIVKKMQAVIAQMVELRRQNCRHRLITLIGANAARCNLCGAPLLRNGGGTDFGYFPLDSKLSP